MRRKLIASSFLALLLIGAGITGAQAQTTDPDAAQPLTAEQTEAQYEELYRAFDVARTCRKLEDEGLNERATDVVSQQTGNQVPIGRQLSLIDSAKRKVEKFLKAEGCEGPKASEALGIYDARVAPYM